MTLAPPPPRPELREPVILLDDPKRTPSPGPLPWVTWLLALLIVVAAPVVAVVLVGRQPAVEVAEAEVLAVAGRDATTAVQIETAVATEAVILESRAVIEPAAASLGITAEELQERLDMDVLGSSLALRVRAEHEDADAALASVETVVREYLRISASGDSEDRQLLLQARIDELVAQRSAIEERLDVIEPAEAGAELLDLSGQTAEARRLRSESQQLLERVGALEDEVLAIDLEVAAAEQPVVVSAPHVLEDSAGPDTRQALAFGLFVGLAVAGLLLVGRYQLRAMRNRPG